MTINLFFFFLHLVILTHFASKCHKCFFRGISAKTRTVCNLYFKIKGCLSVYLSML